jgi:chlorite dismutase
VNEKGKVTVNRPAHSSAQQSEPTIKMNDGWHCLHLYYRVCPSGLAQLSESQRAAGRAELLRLLDPGRPGAPVRLATSVVSGHKADLALLMMDPDPLVIDSVRQSIRSSPLGSALVPAYSFVSITEVSEYVPTVEQYGERLKAEGTDPASPAFAAKLRAYEERETMMRKQRLFPDFPPWPVLCFYPMNKIRHPLANWYTRPFSQRMEMMAEHGKSGMKFAGRVSQVITASTGLDDWEWGVTLWAREPAFLKEIVYTMRFDEASANYAEFGPFYMSYVLPPPEALKHLQL